MSSLHGTRILVVGGAGFVGGNLVRDVLDQGAEAVVVVDNFLSDDRRYSVRELGTNVARAMATNAQKGHVWEEFSSETYKQLTPAGTITGLYNPRKPDDPIQVTVAQGGYYRTPSLVSMWVIPASTAARSTASAPSRSAGGPMTHGPASCIAP